MSNNPSKENKLPGQDQSDSEQDAKREIEWEKGERSPIQEPIREAEEKEEEQAGNTLSAVKKYIKGSQVAVHETTTTIESVQDSNVKVIHGDENIFAFYVKSKLVRRVARSDAEQEAYERRQVQLAEALLRDKEAPMDSADFEKWFSGFEEAEIYYFIITAALFEGVDWASFLEIHSRILRDVGLTANEEEARHIDTYRFEMSDDKLTKQTCVTRTAVIEEGDYGKITTNVVSLQRIGLRGKILEAARKRYSNQLLKFQEVILQYGRHPKWDLRVKAAEAAAELAQIDFNHVWHFIVRSWAMDSTRYVRAVVGYFVAYLLNHSLLVGNVLRELHRWADADETDAWQLRWTATAALKEVADHRTEHALKELKRLALDPNGVVVEAVIYSIVRIYESGHASAVIQMLSEWAKLPEHTRDRRDEDLERYALSVWALFILGLTNFEERRANKTHNLFSLLAQSADSNVARNVAAILMPTKRESLGFAFDLLRTWAKSDVPHAAEATSNITLALYERVDDRRRAAIENFVNRWQRSTREPALQKVGNLVSQRLGAVSA